MAGHRPGRSVLDGAAADVVTLAIPSDIDALRKHALVNSRWGSGLPNDSLHEAILEVQESERDREIVRPAASIRAEPNVAWVDTNVKRKGTELLARAYLESLDAPEALRAHRQARLPPDRGRRPRAACRRPAAGASVSDHARGSRLGRGWRGSFPKSALAGLLTVTAVRLVDWKRLAYALRASRFDAVLVVDSATNAGIVSVEYVRPAAGEIYYMV